MSCLLSTLGVPLMLIGCTIVNIIFDSRSEIRLAIQLLVIFIIYNICWGPYFAISLFIDPQGEFPEWCYCILLTLLFWNSAVNVLVYLYFNKTFRLECFQAIGVKGDHESGHQTSTGTAGTTVNQSY